MLVPKIPVHIWCTKGKDRQRSNEGSSLQLGKVKYGDANAQTECFCTFVLEIAVHRICNSLRVYREGQIGMYQS